VGGVSIDNWGNNFLNTAMVEGKIRSLFVKKAFFGGKGISDCVRKEGICVVEVRGVEVAMKDHLNN